MQGVVGKYIDVWNGGFQITQEQQKKKGTGGLIGQGRRTEDIKRAQKKNSNC